MKEEEQKQEETLKKLRDVEKQRRLAAREAEDLTVALSQKVAALDDAQRKLRRLENKVRSPTSNFYFCAYHLKCSLFDIAWTCKGQSFSNWSIF